MLLDAADNRHHLLQHAVPQMERVAQCFDGACPKEIARMVSRMGQRDLQSKFNMVYNTVTRSNNNEWLRRKLLEAVGMKMSLKSKCALKGAVRKQGGKPRESRHTSGDSSQSSMMRFQPESTPTRAPSPPAGGNHESCDSDTSRQSSQQQAPLQVWQMSSPYASTANMSPVFGSPRSMDAVQRTYRAHPSGYTAVGVAFPGKQRQLPPQRVLSPAPSQPGGHSDSLSAFYIAQPMVQPAPYAQDAYGSSGHSSSSYCQALYPQLSATPQAAGHDVSNFDAACTDPLLAIRLPRLDNEPASPAAGTSSALKSGSGHPHALNVMVTPRPSIYDDAEALNAELEDHENMASTSSLEESCSDLLRLTSQPGASAGPTEMALDEALDAALEDLASEAYTNPSPERMYDVTKTLTRVHCCLAKWQQAAERARLMGVDWTTMTAAL